MSRRKDLTNQKFGRLTVIGPAPCTRNSRGASVVNWYAKCECGNTLTVRSVSLLSGNTKSCGCLRDEAIRRSKNHKVNEYIFHDNYVEGKTFNGESFYVDIEDYETIRDICWGVATKKGYLGGYTLGSDRRLILLHRLVMDAPPDMKVDHINHDSADNRKCNLRIVTHQQNMVNTKKNRANKSGYKGVWWSKSSRKWYAYISYKGKRIHLGTFANKEDAIAARQAAEKQYYGEYRYEDSIDAVPRIETSSDPAPVSTLPAGAILIQETPGHQPSALV